MHVKLQSYLAIKDCSLAASVWKSRTDFFFLHCLYATIPIYQHDVLYFFRNYLFFSSNTELSSWFFQFTHTFTQIVHLLRHCLLLFWSFCLMFLSCLGSLLGDGYFCRCLDHFSSLFCKRVHSWAYFCKTFLGGWRWQCSALPVLRIKCAEI